MNTSKTVMIILGLIIIVMFALVVIVAPPKDNAIDDNTPWVAFDSIDSQLDLVDRVHAKWFGDRIDVMNKALGKHVVCDWLMYKSCAVTNCPALNESLEKFNADSMDFAASEGIKSDYWASVVVWEEFLKAYQNEADKKALLDTCAEITPDLAASFNNEISSFKQFAKTEGLLDANDKVIPGKERLLLLLHRYVWVKGSSIQFPRNSIMPPEEDVAVLRWQVEQSKMPNDKKIARIKDVMQISPNGYDYKYAEAVVNFQLGYYGEACKIISPLTKQNTVADEKSLKKYAKFIKEIRKAAPTACPN